MDTSTQTLFIMRLHDYDDASIAIARLKLGMRTGSFVRFHKARHRILTFVRRVI